MGMEHIDTDDDAKCMDIFKGEKFDADALAERAVSLGARVAAVLRCAITVGQDGRLSRLCNGIYGGFLRKGAENV